MKRLGDLLVDTGIITQAQLKEALFLQKSSDSRLGDVLIEKGWISENQLIEVLEFQLGIPHVHLYKSKIDPAVTHLITENIAKRYMVLPLYEEGSQLVVAMADPLDYVAIDDLRMRTGYLIRPVITSKEEINMTIQRVYGLQESVERVIQKGPQIVSKEELVRSDRSEDGPIIQMVNQMIGQAIQWNASDIHVDPSENHVRIRYRVDGVLRTEQTMPISMHSLIVSRLKIMAQLNIAERRLPQDGRLEIKQGMRKVDLRIATLPTVHGEKAVIRILDPDQSVNRMDKLGFTTSNEQLFKKIIQRSHGLMLVTGPTGSGKTSTLYSAIHEFNTEQMNLVTLEDPVEYQIDGVNQVQVFPQAGLTFAQGLRSVLRQDPDVIMVGEIRDADTADMAVRAALTGHLVLSTLHTNDAVGAIIRLIHMGVEPFLVASAAVGVVAQRLVRKICPDCREQVPLTGYEQELFIQRGIPLQLMTKGKGCGRCNLTGYRGRLAIQEVLYIDDRIRTFIIDRKPEPFIRQYAMENGMVSLIEDGLAKAAKGWTTASEVIRVASAY